MKSSYLRWSIFFYEFVRLYSSLESSFPVSVFFHLEQYLKASLKTENSFHLWSKSNVLMYR